MTRPLDLETQLANQAHIVFLPEENDRSQLAQLLVALANERGGVILIGLASAQKLGKLPDPEAARDRLMTLALEIDPPLIIPTPEIQT
jgi:predicted HTH transcriptional regulator